MDHGKCNPAELSRRSGHHCPAAAKPLKDIESKFTQMKAQE
jgi:hypothetical protein